MAAAIHAGDLAMHRLTGTEKGLPARAGELTVRELLGAEPRLHEFWTPLLVLDDSAINNNLSVMADWCALRGFTLMPHGKTTMAPRLWQRQIDAGATGIALATIGQIRTARVLGFSSLMLANELTDARGLSYIAAELADPELRFTCWADSVEAVDVMERALAGVTLPRAIEVCVELGASGGRTGARTIAEALAVARRISDSGVFRLAGVAGYEGCLAHDRSADSIDAVRTYLSSILELHAALGDLYDGGEVIVTVGGSAFFDVIAEVFEPSMSAPSMSAQGNTRWVLRSGAYITHDHGFYRGLSPMDASFDSTNIRPLRPAMMGLTRVVSRPEHELVLLDGGKRDFPYDEGLPIPLTVASELGADPAPFAEASVTRMNDQHTYLSVKQDAELKPGSVVRLGLSHPCTAFDKWRFIPVVADAGSDRVVDLIQTFF